MPSPLAHAAVAFVISPLLPHKLRRTSVKWLLAIAVMLCLPDVDFLISRVTDYAWLTHGGATHSITFAVISGISFGGLATALHRGASRRGFLCYTLLGLGCILLHILIDAMTYRSGGLMLFWPLTEHRYRLPFSVFYGVRHSDPSAWHLHLFTLTTELGFAAVIIFVSRYIRCIFLFRNQTNLLQANLGPES